MAKNSIDGKTAFNYIIKNVLEPMGIGADINDFGNATNNIDSEETINNLKSLVLNFISKVYIPGNYSSIWLKSADIGSVEKILTSYGFDVSLFDFANSSRDLLIAFGFLVWKSDVLASMYEKYLPTDKSLLPPYKTNVSIPCIVNEVNVKHTGDGKVHLKCFSRKSNCIQWKIKQLCDIESDMSQTLTQIKSLEPSTSGFELCMKASTDKLKSYSDALKFINSKECDISKVSEMEKIFFKFLYEIVTEKFNFQTEPSKTSDFPDFTLSPTKKYNRRVESLESALEKLEKEVSHMSQKCLCDNLDIDEKRKKSIEKEIDRIFAAMENPADTPDPLVLDSSNYMIPEFPSKTFDTNKLSAISSQLDQKSDSIREESLKILDNKIEELAKRIDCSTILKSRWKKEALC